MDRAVDLDSLGERALAVAEGTLRGDADLVDARLARRRLDAVDEGGHLALERVERRQEIGLEDDEEIAVIAFEIERRAGEHAKRLHHQGEAEALVAAERKERALSRASGGGDRRPVGVVRDPLRQALAPAVS